MRHEQQTPGPHASGRGGVDWTERLRLEIALTDMARELSTAELRALLVAMTAPRIKRAAPEEPLW